MACCSSQGHKELDVTCRLNNNHKTKKKEEKSEQVQQAAAPASVQTAAPEQEDEKKKEEAMERINSVKDVWDGLEIAQKKALIRSVIDKILIFRDKINIYYRF